MAQLMPVRFNKHVLFNPYISAAITSFAELYAHDALIFIVMVTVFTIGTELKKGTAREWIETGNGSVSAALLGKVLPVTVVMFLMSLVMFLIIFKVVGVLNGSLTVILLSTLLFVMSYQAIAVFIVSLLSNLRLSLSIDGGYSVLAFTFFGTRSRSWPWPAMQYLSRLFPFAYYTDIFVDQMLGHPMYLLPDLCYMSLFIVLPLLCLPRLKRVCTEEKFWGRL